MICFCKILLIFSRLYELYDIIVEDNLNDLIRIFPYWLAVLLSFHLLPLSEAELLGGGKWDFFPNLRALAHTAPQAHTEFYFICAPKVILAA